MIPPTQVPNMGVYRGLVPIGDNNDQSWRLRYSIRYTP
jgi:hypothetical protein